MVSCNKLLNSTHLSSCSWYCLYRCQRNRYDRFHLKLLPIVLAKSRLSRFNHFLDLSRCISLFLMNWFLSYTSNCLSLISVMRPQSFLFHLISSVALQRLNCEQHLWWKLEALSFLGHPQAVFNFYPKTITIVVPDYRFQRLA